MPKLILLHWHSLTIVGECIFYLKFFFSCAYNKNKGSKDLVFSLARLFIQTQNPQKQARLYDLLKNRK